LSIHFAPLLALGLSRLLLPCGIRKRLPLGSSRALEFSSVVGSAN
jgi:hypothetical protein